MVLERMGSALAIPPPHASVRQDSLNKQPLGVGVYQSLALTWAEDHIRVNAIAPGRIATERIQELDRAQAERTHTPISDIHQAQLAAIPLRRTGNPEEFAKLAAFLLSPAASYITGETIVIGGGV